MYLNKTDFNAMRKSLSDFDKQRESMIRMSRDVLRLSKQSIYSVHRSNMGQAHKLLSDAKKLIEKLKKAIKKDNALEQLSLYSGALQEYAEAFTFLGFVRNKKIPTSRQAGVDYENYLLGLCDLTGELARRAVILATAKDKKELNMIRDVIDEIHGEFIKFNFRNSELRRKYDSIKWNLKKVEDLVYDLSK